MAESEKTPKRRGRPPASERDKKRHTLSFRLTDDLKEELHKRANYYGRSLSEEVETILTVELFSDIKKHEHVSLDSDKEMEKLYNRQIDVINSCIAFQNIMTKIFVDILNVDMMSGSNEIASLIGVYMSMHDITRFKLGEIQKEAMDRRDEIFIEFACQTVPGLSSIGPGGIQEMKEKYKSGKDEMHKALLIALEERGVDIHFDKE